MTKLEGMTKHDCATGCNAERCVISNRGFCLHPMKSGMGAVETDPDVKAAYSSACEMLGFKNKLPAT